MIKIIIKHSILWLIPLAIYIFEIVMVCTNGATMVSNICAWACCIVLLLQIAIPCIVRVCKSEIHYKQAEKKLDEFIKKYLEEDND